MHIIDLTMPIDQRTPVFPGDPKQEIKQFATVRENGWNEKRLTFNSHFSTHIDAPLHMLENGKKLSDFSIDKFVGEAVVIDVRGQQEINTSLDSVKEGDIVFFLTDYSKNAYSPDYFDGGPVISPDTARKLIEKKVRIVGLDSWTPDKEPYEVHKMLFKHDVLIVENLVNLGSLAGKRFTCCVLPLKIQDGDGAPCRIIAMVN